MEYTFWCSLNFKSPGGSKNCIYIPEHKKITEMRDGDTVTVIINNFNTGKYTPEKRKFKLVEIK